MLTLPASADDAAAKWSDYYEIETVATPGGVVPEVGGIDVLDDGRLVVAFERGEVFLYDPRTEQWSPFAEGLHNPLGILAVSEREFIVSQRPEVTRLLDTTGDGAADTYQTVTDAFGISGNYHEFHFGPVRDAAGNLYISLGTASAAGGVRHEVRGERNPNALPIRMFSPVPYRGWVMKITPDGEIEPFAPGFRAPNGLGFDAEGRLFVTDNQGDWIGTSPLYHVEEGNFYGHVASMLWTEGWDQGNPAELPAAYHAERRTRAAVELPHGIMASSPTQPLLDTTGGRFGPFEGQLFIGDMNHSHLIRVALEEVAGKIQGACFPFHNGHGLRRGNNRMVFAPDGSLWTGQTHRQDAWAGDTGLHRITWTGETPLEVQTMSLTDDGFELTFTRPLDPAVAAERGNYHFVRYAYAYDEAYGSPQHHRREIEVNGLTVSEDRTRVRLILDDLQPGFIYELRLDNLHSDDNHPLMNTWMMYTVNYLRDGSPPPAFKDLSAH
ncbi:MAG: hypothetical protein WD294_17095 [Phycisphaeraceae bacterium]